MRIKGGRHYNGLDGILLIIGGVTRFLMMAYIIFVQPAVLSACGLDFGSVLVTPG